MFEDVETRILIADDDPYWRTEVLNCLESERHYSISFATDHSDTIATLRNNDIDIVCLNVLLRRQEDDSWKEEWVKLLDEAKERNVDVILISAKDRLIDIYDELEEYGAKFIGKESFEAKDFLRKIEHFVDIGRRKKGGGRFMQLAEKIEKDVSGDDLQSALDKLKNYAKTDPEMRKEITLHERQYHSLQNKKRRSTINEHDFVAQMNTLAESILDTLYIISSKENEGGQAVSENGKIVVTEKYIDIDVYVGSTGNVRISSCEGERSAQVKTEAPSELTLNLPLIEARQTNEELLKTLGIKLYKYIFSEAIHAHFNQTEAVARSLKQKLRIRLNIQADSLASLPWEFIYREEGNYFLSTNPDTVFSRYLELPLPQNQTRRQDGPLHMLLIIADPHDQVRLKPNNWEKIIQDALASPLKEQKLVINTVEKATRREISKALLEYKPDIIQFVGHGIYQNDKGYLALVDEKTDGTWEVDDTKFRSLFSGALDNLGLVCLATCESAKSNSPQGFLGIAPKIVEMGVPAVVAMQYKVRIGSAEIFLEEFYNAIAARKPVDWAVQWARNQVAIEQGLDNREFATPVLFMRAKDGNIF